MFEEVKIYELNDLVVEPTKIIANLDSAIKTKISIKNKVFETNSDSMQWYVYMKYLHIKP